MTRPGKARRWPDLLIGLLVLLLVAGFGALLVGQRSQPVAQTPPTPTADTPATETPPTDAASVAEPPTGTITIPSAPGTDAPPDEPSTETTPPPLASGEEGETSSETAENASPGTDEPTTADAPDAPASDEPTATEPSTDAAPSTTQDTPTAEIPVVPADPVTSTETTPGTPEQPDQTPSTPAQPPAATTPPRSTAGAVATSERRTPLRSDYRVSLGSFATTRTAERQTEGVRGLGYTVYPIDLGEQVVAQVGPFADEATARRALADIQRAYPGAVIYPPRGRRLTGGTVSESVPAPAPQPAPTPVPDSNRTTPQTPAPSAPTAATPAPPESVPGPATAPAAAAAAAAATPSTSAEPQPRPQAAAPTPTTAPAPAAQSGPVYLQVGAFDQAESAQNLVARLRGEGYAPTVSAPDGRKVTVLIGPFSGNTLTNAETDLAASGIEFFRVR